MRFVRRPSSSDLRRETSWQLRALLLLLVLLGLTACGAESSSSSEIGRIDAPLVTQSASGTTYRLEGVTLTVSGPTNATLTSNDTDPNETELTAELPVGTYSALLEPGWSLVRLTEDGPTVVDADLLSPNPTTLTIQSNAVTHLTLSFAAEGAAIQFAPGSLEVDFEVIEGTPSLPLLAAEPVSLPGTPIDLAAGAGRAFVLAGTSLAGFDTSGAKVFETAPGFSGGTPRAVLADDQDAIVVSTNTSNIVLTRVEGTTGGIIDSLTFPTNSSLVTQSGVCAVRDAAGRVVVATNENGAEVRVRAFSGGALHYLTFLSGPYVQPTFCDLVAKPDGSVVHGGRAGGQRIHLTHVDSNGFAQPLGTFGVGVTSGFQLADGSGQSVFAAWSDGNRLSFGQFGAGFDHLLAEHYDGPNAVSDLLTGTFAGQSPSLLLAGQLGGEAFLGTFSWAGAPQSVNTGNGTGVVAADAGQGLIWSLIAQGGSEYVLHVHPQ